MLGGHNSQERYLDKRREAKDEAKVMNKREYMMKPGLQGLERTLSTEHMMGHLSKENPQRQEIKFKGPVSSK